jgi:hypothetical protein
MDEENDNELTDDQKQQLENEELFEKFDFAMMQDIVAHINVGVISFYSFLKYKSNDQKGRVLLKEFLEMASKIKVHLDKILNDQESSEQILVGSLERTCDLIERADHNDSLKSLLDGSNRFFAFVLTASNDPEGRTLHEQILVHAEKIKNYLKEKGIKDDVELHDEGVSG